MDEPEGASPTLSPLNKRELLARALQRKIALAEGWLPLSYSQQMFGALERLAPESAVNSEAFALRYSGELKQDVLKTVYRDLTARHPCLRSTYKELAGDTVQRFNDEQDLLVEAADATAWSADELQERVSAEAHRPFDLARGPVSHVHLYKRGRKETILLTMVHHLAIDLCAMAVLMEEVQTLYLARRFGFNRSLPPLAAHYKDLLPLQEQALKGPEGERLWDYWKTQLAGPISGLDLPGDRPRPATPSFRGSTEPIRLDADLTSQLRALAKSEQTTLFSTLLAAFQVLLGRLTGQRDVVIASRTSGRNRPEFERVIGCFINRILLRGDLSGTPGFRSVIRQARQVVQSALAHQDYPFSLLLSRLDLPPGLPAPGNVVFVLQQPHRFSTTKKKHEDVESFGIHSQAELGGRVGIGGQSVEIFPVELQVARHDLEFEMVESTAGLFGWMRYNLDLFDPSRIARLLRAFEALLKELVAAPDRPISFAPLD